MGGTIDVNVKGDIRIEGAGNVVYAQKNGAGAESEINIHADGDIFLSSNSGVAVSASSLNTADAGYKSTVSITSGKSVTIESQGTAVSASGSDWKTHDDVSNNNTVNITAADKITLSGANAILATNGISSSQTAGVVLSGKTIESNGAIKADTYAVIKIGGNEGFDKAIINGDVTAAASSSVDINLGNAGSFTGSVVRDSGTDTASSVDLDLGTGSSWTVTGASSVSNVNGNGALILTDKASTVSIDKVDGSIDAGFATLTADDFANADELADMVQVEEVTEGSTVTTTVAEGDIKGAMTVTQDENGTSSTTSVNGKLDSFKSVNVIGLMQWRHEMNDLTKRMGELRDSPEGIGSWARVYGSEYEHGSQNVEAKNTSIQVGMDFDVGYGWKVGAAFSYTNTDATMDNGTADGDMYGFAVYGSWLHESGQFVDLIAKYTRMDNDFDIGNMSGSYDNNGYSVSAEYGWNLRFNGLAFVEPQVELTYGTMTGDDFTASNGVRIEQDDTDSFIGRIGVRGGFLFPNNKGTIYARASVLHDFDGETGFKATKGTSDSFTEDLGGTWYEFGVGANFNVTDQTYTYVDLERTTSAEVNENWRWNVGIRHVW